MIQPAAECKRPVESLVGPDDTHLAREQPGFEGRQGAGEDRAGEDRSEGEMPPADGPTCQQEEQVEQRESAGLEDLEVDDPEHRVVGPIEQVGEVEIAVLPAERQPRPEEGAAEPTFESLERGTQVLLHDATELREP